MPDIRVSITLPYLLRVATGEYVGGPAGETIRIELPPLLEGTLPRSIVRATCAHAETDDADVIQREKARDADQLLRRTNRLLRWYRCVSGRTETVELTRAQVSPFRFEVIGEHNSVNWTQPIAYEEQGPAPAYLTIEQISESVQHGLASGNEPDVAVLFLLDAERALQQGRFREAVLFSWSTIDSIFNQKFDALVDAGLDGEWAAAREFFKGHDFGLRNKMSAGMRLFAKRSLFAEPAPFWDHLSTSYAKRNDIIHRGQNASEDEARLAIEVAHAVVSVMRAVALPSA
jgi:hypothetical protein